MRVAVVGAGTAGLITALILKKNLNIQVDVIQSSKIGIIGVGEGSTEQFSDFMRFTGITPDEIIKECDATFKSGIMFDGWGEKPFLHNVSETFTQKHSMYSYTYSKQISENNDYLTPHHLWENNINTYYSNKPDVFLFNQFHFNTFKLNSFLILKCKNTNIQFFDDEITKVNINQNNHIESIQGKYITYNYDFYIDCTGFKRILINQLGAKWDSFKDFLKMKSAITFPTGDENNYNLWTLAKTMDNGWLFRLPTWGRYGNGYIFDSDYTDAQGAKQEVEKLFKKEIDFGREFIFDPGALKKVWINNCVAVGLSAMFVEPLEASSIGCSINQAFLLMNRLLNYDQSSIDKYNDAFTDIALNIRDFIALHYVNNKKNTEFWKNINSIELPESLHNNLNHWRNHLPISEDFKNLSRYILFKEDNYTIVMNGLNLFNLKNIKNEYNMLPSSIHKKANFNILNAKKIDYDSSFYTHKEHLRMIKKLS